jgi:hypothetical protein
MELMRGGTSGECVMLLLNGFSNLQICIFLNSCQFTQCIYGQLEKIRILRKIVEIYHSDTDPLAPKIYGSKIFENPKTNS